MAEIGLEIGLGLSVNRRWGSNGLLLGGFDPGGFSPGFYGGSNSGFAEFVGPPPKLAEWFVDPAGSSLNSGTIGSPWSWDYARTGAGGAILPGHWVWCLGGTYSGAIGDITVGGTVGLPVVFRAYDPTGYSRVRAWFRSSRSVTVDASYVWIWGLEMSGIVGARRISTQTTGDLSAPTDIDYSSWQPGSANRRGIKFIHCIEHDVAAQTFVGSGSPEFEMYGQLGYNQGWEGFDRGHAHNFYIQNNNPELHRFRNCVQYGSFDNLCQIYGTGASYQQNILIEKTALFHSGSPCKAPPGGQRQLVDMYNPDITHMGPNYFRQCSLFEGATTGGPVFGDPNRTADFPDFEFTDCISQGQSEFAYAQRLNAQRNRFARIQAVDGTRTVFRLRVPAGFTNPAAIAALGNTIDNNNYAWVSDATFKGLHLFPQGGGSTSNSLAQWQTATGYDTNSTYTNALVFSIPDIRYFPSIYEAGRGWVHCWNWQDAASLNLDLSQALPGIQNGWTYESRHVYDYFGTPVTTGTYSGSTVAHGQTGYTYPVPLDYPNYPGVASASPRFNVFEVRRTG